jgi:hypothetical protein
MVPEIYHVRYGNAEYAMIGYEYHTLSYIVQYAERLRIFFFAENLVLWARSETIGYAICPI